MSELDVLETIAGRLESLEYLATCLVYLLGMVWGGLTWLLVLYAKNAGRFW